MRFWWWLVMIPVLAVADEPSFDPKEMGGVKNTAGIGTWRACLSPEELADLPSAGLFGLDKLKMGDVSTSVEETYREDSTLVSEIVSYEKPDCQGDKMIRFVIVSDIASAGPLDGNQEGQKINRRLREMKWGSDSEKTVKLFNERKLFLHVWEKGKLYDDLMPLVKKMTPLALKVYYSAFLIRDGKTMYRPKLSGSQNEESEKARPTTFMTKFGLTKVEPPKKKAD